jgi:large repetitive protein
MSAGLIDRVAPTFPVDPERSCRVRVFLALIVTVLAALVVSSAGALDIQTEVSLQDGQVGQPYEFQFTADEGCQPYSFFYSSGTIPPGLTIELDGKLDGTPTQPGRFVFWIEVRDGVPGGACHSETFSQGQYTVIISPQVVIAANLHGAKVGMPFSAVIAATGGGSLEWSLSDGALPPGLTLNRVDGTLSGTPTTTGSYTFTVKVGDDKRKATKQYSFVVAAPLAVAAATLPAAEIGVPLNATVPSTGGIGPLQWGGTLPGGLTLDASKGTIQGTPTSAGSFSLPLTVTDSDGQAVNATAMLSVARRLAIVTSKAPAARVGKAYRLRLGSVGGVSPRVWRIVRGKLPLGLKFNRNTGTVSGTPRRAGHFSLTIKLADKLGVTHSRTLTLAVQRR